MLTGACAAGQHAQTAEEKPSLDGTFGNVGNIQIEGVAFHAPNGASYPSGASVPLAAYIANNGTSPDKLVKVESSAFSGGWAVESGSSSGSSSSSGSGNGQPQTIGPNQAVGFGLQDLGSSGAGSPKTIVLRGLTAQSAPLFPGTAVKVTFTFANAGQTTLTVPVQISTDPHQQTLPVEQPGTPAA